MDWDSTFQRLAEIEQLEDNYDSEGSCAAKRDCLIAANNYLMLQEATGYSPPDHISLEGDGSVLIEWRDGDSSTELLIDSPPNAEAMYCIDLNCTFSEVTV